MLENQLLERIIVTVQQTYVNDKQHILLVQRLLCDCHAQVMQVLRDVVLIEE